MKLTPRHLIIVNLLLLAVVAYAGALSVSTAVAARLGTPSKITISPLPPPLKREDKRPASYYSAISARDIFNSVKPQEVVPTPAPVITECKGKLLGVVVNKKKPEQSYAVIETASDHKQDAYRVGRTVPNCGTIKEVAWEQIILTRDGRDEIMKLQIASSLTGPPPGGLGAAAGGLGSSPAAVAAAGGAGAPGAPAGQTAGGIPFAPADAHIKQLSENEYQIDRSEVDNALQNMNQLFTQMRAVPHFEGGKSVGFRLFAIKQGSLFDKLGLRNGDIVQEINGRDISDAGAALQMFQDLRGESQITVKAIRNKEPRTLSYGIN